MKCWRSRRYLRRNGWEPSHDALRKRLKKGLRSGSVTREAVTEYVQNAEPIPTPEPILKVGSKTKPIPPPRVRFENPVSTTRPTPHRERNLFRYREQDLFPYQEKLSKLKPTPPPRKRKEKLVPPQRTRNVKPVPMPRTRNVKPVPPPNECEHGTTEEIDGVTFCIHCGLEIDYNPLQRRFLREDRVFCTSRRKDPIFKKRTKPRETPKEKYIPVSSSEVPLLVRKEKDKEIEDQILGYLGLLDEN